MQSIISSAYTILQFQKDTISTNIASIKGTLHPDETLNIVSSPEPVITTNTSKLYKKIALVCHPDRNPSLELCEAFKELPKDSSVSRLFDFISKNNIDVDISSENYKEAYKELFKTLELIAKNVNNPFFKWEIMEDNEKKSYLDKLRKS
tara:strand:- start:64 stop:510 length:447 start_codon:yes stop_codon:yes gene_type:complete